MPQLWSSCPLHGGLVAWLALAASCTSSSLSRQDPLLSADTNRESAGPMNECPLGFSSKEQARPFHGEVGTQCLQGAGARAAEGQFTTARSVRKSSSVSSRAPGTLSGRRAHTPPRCTKEPTVKCSVCFQALRW